MVWGDGIFIPTPPGMHFFVGAAFYVPLVILSEAKNL